MHIHTIEEDFEYRMKKIIQSMRDDYDELKNLDPEELQNQLINNKMFSKDFAGRVVDDCINFSGDELFERRNKMNSNYTKTVSYCKYENDICVSEKYVDGSIRGEFLIKNTELGFQLTAYHDSWKVLKECTDLIELLGGNSMAGVTMEALFEKIKELGYVGEVY